MPADRVTLDLSAFLDSPQARSLDGVAPDARRAVAERLLESAHRDLGTPPAELDGTGLRDLVVGVLPLRFERDDPLLPAVEPVLRAFLAHLREAHVVTHAFEQDLALEPALDEFARLAAELSGPRRRTERESRPVKYGAERTGRNDPCPCGSGLKFKRCHGRGA